MFPLPHSCPETYLQFPIKLQTRKVSLLSHISTLSEQNRFDDEVKEEVRFLPRHYEVSSIFIETFLEGVTEKSTILPIFKDLVWFVSERIHDGYRELQYTYVGVGTMKD